MLRSLVTGSLAIGIAVPAVSASVTFYTDPAQFTAAVAALHHVGTENFQSSNAVQAALASPLTFGVPNVDSLGHGFPNGLSFEPLTISASSGPGPNKLMVAGPGSGLQSLSVGGFEPADSTMLSFAGDNFLAASFNALIFGGGNEMSDIKVFDGGDNMLGMLSLVTPRNPAAFVGVVSLTPIAWIDVAGQQDGGQFVDNVALWIPEPASASLFALAAVGLLRRRSAR